MNQNERFRHLDRKSAELINVVTNSNLKYDEGNEVVDMCKAINDLVENSKNEAREEMAKELISDGAYSFEKIAEISKLPMSRIQELSNEIKASA